MLLLQKDVILLVIATMGQMKAIVLQERVHLTEVYRAPAINTEMHLVAAAVVATARMVMMQSW